MAAVAEVLHGFWAGVVGPSAPQRVQHTAYRSGLSSVPKVLAPSFVPLLHPLRTSHVGRAGARRTEMFIHSGIPLEFCSHGV